MTPKRAHRGMTTTPTNAMLRVALLAMFLLFGIVLGAGPAAAHAELASSTPSNGATIQTCPQSITLAFDEAVATGGLTVTVNGHATAPHPTTDDNQHFVVRARSCKPGATTLTWRTVSADDGHVANGTVHFHVLGTAPATKLSNPASPAVSSTTDGASTLLALFRATGYTCLALLGGGLMFVTFLWPSGAGLRRVRWMLIAATAGGGAAAIGALWSTLKVSGMSLAFALRLPFGREYAALALLWMLAVVVVVDFLQRREQAVNRFAWRMSALMVFLGIGVVEAMSAHAYASDNRTIGLIADLTHLSAMSVWIGGLVTLSIGAIPRLRGPELNRVVHRFSTWAQVSVGSVVLSGLVLLYDVILPLPRFWGTHYATVLAIKLSFLAAALLAATGSQTWVKRLRTRSTDRGMALIATSVGLETLCALAVLAAAGTLVTSSPGV